MWTLSKTRRACGRSIGGRPQGSRLAELDAAVEQRSAVGIAVAQGQAERADACHAVDRYCGERHGIAVVGPAAEQSDAIGRIVEDDRLKLRRLEVHIRAGVLSAEVVLVEILAVIPVHREARLAAAGRVDVAIAIRLVARWRRPVLAGGLEVEAADA